MTYKTGVDAILRVTNGKKLSFLASVGLLVHKILVFELSLRRKREFGHLPGRRAMGL